MDHLRKVVSHVRCNTELSVHPLVRDVHALDIPFVTNGR